MMFILECCKGGYAFQKKSLEGRLFQLRKESEVPSLLLPCNP